MGRYWYYDQGKYLNKANTFKDFIACAEHLIAEGWTASDRLAIEGRSAGGLLVGAVLNMRPDLFAVALAGVPFVDVMVTMSGLSHQYTSCSVSVVPLFTSSPYTTHKYIVHFMICH